jgi:hypothetical protein
MCGQVHRWPIWGLLALVSCTAEGGPISLPDSQREIRPGVLLQHNRLGQSRDADRDRRIQAVAKSVALTLSDPVYRQFLLDEMRASEWTEHKLSLQDFFMSEKSQLFLSRSSLSSGMSVLDFTGLLSSLPDLDFYLPLKHHRISWTGNRNVAVVGFYDPDSDTVDGFLLDGTAVTLTMADVDRFDAIIAIHGAEQKMKRVSIGSPRRPTIQAPAEPGWGGALIIVSDDGEETVIPLAVAPTPTAQGTSGLDVPARDAWQGQHTLMHKFEVYFDDNFGGSNELEFGAAGWIDENTIHPPGYIDPILRYTGIDKNTIYQTVGQDELVYDYIPEGLENFIFVHLTETDIWAFDDNKGALTAECAHYYTWRNFVGTVFDPTEVTGRMQFKTTVGLLPC